MCGKPQRQVLNPGYRGEHRDHWEAVGEEVGDCRHGCTVVSSREDLSLMNFEDRCRVRQHVVEKEGLGSWRGLFWPPNASPMGDGQVTGVTRRPLAGVVRKPRSDRRSEPILGEPPILCEPPILDGDGRPMDTNCGMARREPRANPSAAHVEDPDLGSDRKEHQCPNNKLW